MAPQPPLPPQSSADLTAHALSVLDFLVKLVAGMGALWVGVTKIAKPYTAWRRSHYAELTRDILHPELDALAKLRTDDGQVREMCREILEGQDKLLARQDQIFNELDLVHTVAHENSDRHDEMNLLLDEVGFTSDRRRATAREQRDRVEKLLAELRKFKIARDRRDEPPDPPIGESS